MTITNIEKLDIQDMVFPKKEHVRRDSIFINHGVLQPGTHWRVMKLATYRRTKFGDCLYPTDEIVHLNDQVTLRCVETKETRTTSYSNLKYNSIWWLEVS